MKLMSWLLLVCEDNYLKVLTETFIYVYVSVQWITILPLLTDFFLPFISGPLPPVPETYNF